MTKWNNFNDAEDQMSYGLIPHKTIAKVRMLIKCGGYSAPDFPDGYATLSKAGTSVYLACEFVVLSGQYEHRKIWSNIGLRSDKSLKYAEIGRSMIKAILNSARGLHSADKSPEAEKLRKINSFSDLQGLVFVAEITINENGDKPRNEIRTIITPDHAKYSEFMNERSGKVKINYTQPNHTQTDDSSIEDELPF